MLNLYWPVFKNLEKEFNELTYYIHIDDKQIQTYSSKISDLILRSAVEIESISKELYLREGGDKTENVRYDSDALKFLNTKWKLDKKIVRISASNCFQSKVELQPFNKNAKKKNGKSTYGWNNSYQYLKHSRAKNLNYGSINNLFEIMAALFLLNVYYKNEVFNLGTYINKNNFSHSLGSEFFSVKVHNNSSINQLGKYNKDDDFDECTYLIKYIKESKENLVRKLQEVTQQFKSQLPENLKYEKYRQSEEGVQLIANNELKKLLGEKNHTQMIGKATLGLPLFFENLKYEAILNQNDI